jgi:GTP-binding protein
MHPTVKIPQQDFIQALFEKKTPLRMEFLCSVMEVADLPRPLAPEFALVGRSNVGKSSLLNFIAGHKQLARVSNTPGRTQTINLFCAEKGAFFLVDLPGYGYAKLTHSMQKHWASAIKTFFEQRGPALFAVFFLIDMRREPNEQDQELCLWLQNLGLKIIAVQTKCDKIHKSKWPFVQQMHAQKLALHPSQIVTTSVNKKIGLHHLMQHMAGTLDALDQETEDSKK